MEYLDSDVYTMMDRKLTEFNLISMPGFIWCANVSCLLSLLIFAYAVSKEFLLNYYSMYIQSANDNMTMHVLKKIHVHANYLIGVFKNKKFVKLELTTHHYSSKKAHP